MSGFLAGVAERATAALKEADKQANQLLSPASQQTGGSAQAETVDDDVALLQNRVRELENLLRAQQTPMRTTQPESSLQTPSPTPAPSTLPSEDSKRIAKLEDDKVKLKGRSRDPGALVRIPRAHLFLPTTRQASRGDQPFPHPGGDVP